MPPHLLKPPPPQYSVPVHVPHWMMRPQPSLFAPQVYPSDWHVRGTQPLPELVPAPDVLPPPLEPVAQAEAALKRA